jgi:hypothetical protein
MGHPAKMPHCKAERARELSMDGGSRQANVLCQLAYRRKRFIRKGLHHLRQPGSPHTDLPPLHLQHKNSASVDRKSQLNMRWPEGQASLQLLSVDLSAMKALLDQTESVDSRSNGRFLPFCRNKQITESHGSLFREFKFSDLCRKHFAMSWRASLVVTVMPNPECISMHH